MSNQEIIAQEPVPAVAILSKEPKKVRCKFGADQEEVIFSIYPQISLRSRIGAVERIAENVLPSNAESIEDYMPGGLLFARRSEIVAAFTDFTLPQDIEAAWAILMYSSLYDMVVDYVGEEQVMSIFKDADCLIAARRESLVRKTEIIKKLTAAADKFGEIASQFSKDDIQRMLDVAKQMPDVSPESLVKAVAAVQ